MPENKNIVIQVKNWTQRSLREGWIGVWRNKFLSITTILLGALILFLLNFVFALKFFADYSLQNLESRASFSVPLREDFDSFRLDGLKNELNNNFQVDISLAPAAQLNDYRVPPRLQIKFQNLREVTPALKTLQKLTYDEVVGTWDASGEKDFVILVEKLLKLRQGIESLSFWLLGLFISGGCLLAINTFRIVMFSRKDEIFIARLVGAQSKFIVGPFLLEGLFMGMIASFIAIFSFIFILKKIDILPGGEIFIYLWNHVFTYEILAAATIGMLGAWLAAKRYLFSPLREVS